MSLPDMRGGQRLLIVLVALFSGASAARAQGPTGTVAGTVVSAVGTPVPGARVTLTGGAVSSRYDTTTDRSGAFGFDDVPVGHYDLSCSLSGFSGIARARVHVTAGERSRLDLTLPIGVAEDVYVSARRRDERLQDVPVSVTVVSEPRLTLSRVVGLADMALLTPNLSFLDTGDSKYSVPRLRGVYGNVLSAGGIDQPTGVYVDEVYMNTSVAQSAELFDVERVEVLRGPQGTLFGRNTISGAIAITTKPPTDRLEGMLEGGYGNAGAVRVRGSLSGPLLRDRLTGRISWLYHARRGHETNRVTGLDVNDLRNAGLRAVLRYRRSDRLHLTFAADYRSIDQNGRAMDIAGYNEDPATAPLGVGPGLIYRLGLAQVDRNGRDRVVTVDDAGFERLRDGGGVLTADLTLGRMALRSITAYRNHSFDQSYDLDSTEVPLERQGAPEHVRMFSQEVRLRSTGTRRVDWLLGGYYSAQRSVNQQNIEISSQSPEARALIRAVNPALVALTYGVTHTDGTVDARSYAAFAHGTWHLTRSADVTAGVRGTYETKRVEYYQTSTSGNSVFGLVEIPYEEHEGHWSAVTPMAAVQYRWTPRVMTYGSVGTGFKSGGFSDIVGSLPGQGFAQETTVNYEAGIKSDVLDRRLVVNGAVFLLDWKDQQATLRKAVGGLSIPLMIQATAGDIRTAGAEIELTAFPLSSHALVVGAQLGVLSSSYTSVTAEASAAGVRVGDRVQNVPDVTVGLSTRYTTPVRRVGSLSCSADFQYRGSLVIRGTTVGGTDVQPGYGLLNAGAELSLAGGHWSVAWWGKNLTNQDYVAFQTSELTNFAFQALRQRLGPPRTFGLDLRYRF